MRRTVFLIAGTVAMLLILSAGVPTVEAQEEPPDLTVNATGDAADANPGDGTCATSSNQCTLRAAIEESNRHIGPDTIAFNISGTGVKTIKLNSQLPNITDSSTTIDGYTQPGSSPNTDSRASNAKITVQITGYSAHKVPGPIVTSSNNTVRGLALYGLKNAILLTGRGAHHNSIVGNFVGTNAAGSYYAGILDKHSNGITMQSGAYENNVGGTSPAERNVISGNAWKGVTFYGELTDHNRILNNIVGLGPKGDRRLQNSTIGLDINTGSSQNRIGGTGPGERNVISGNGQSGVEISHYETTMENEVLGNFIGTDLSGENIPSYAQNQHWGIAIEDRTNNNLVAYNVIRNNRWGGVEFNYNAHDNQIGPGNVIKLNLAEGVSVSGAASDGNTITRNAIQNNSSLGIDLYPLKKTNPNDASDADNSSNEQLNFPVIERATAQRVEGTACVGCVVEVFLASESSSSAYGEGKSFVGWATAGPTGRFAATVTGVAAGNYVTTTATDTAGNTSEFSLNRRVS